jgi:flavin reductase (DIM6/NTAB) family NADH-FMN oxidoreductase RutF
MCYISIRPERHSAPVLKKNMEFVINLTTRQLAYATDWCGVVSGKDHNKFVEMGLTPGKASVVAAPAIEESPLCIECRVREIMPLGSHDMYISDVVNVLADEEYIDKASNAFDMQRAGLLAYAHGQYYTLGDMIGRFGWSVKKKK